MLIFVINHAMATDLIAKTKKYLILTFVLQVALGVDILVVYNLVISGDLPIPMMALMVFHISLMMVTMYIAWYTTCLFFKRRIYKILYGVSGIVTLIVTSMASNPGWQDKPFVDELFLVSALLLLNNITIWFVIIVRDIFFNQHDLTYRIWGAANIYWMLIVIFAYLYFLFELCFPGSFGVHPSSTTEFLNHAFKLSLHSMVSIDHSYHQLSLPMENFSLLQATCSHLFIVFLVGRLLTK
jgi:hypothetical protein